MGKIYKIEEIKEKVKPIAEKYGIETIWLFGSYARGEATEDSDVDLLVDRKTTFNLFELGGAFEDFKDVLKKNVDIVTVRSLYNPVNMPLNLNFRIAIETEKKTLYEQRL